MQGRDGTVSNNLSDSNTYSGIYANHGTNYSIYNNICSSNQTGIVFDGSHDNLVLLNDCVGNSLNNVSSVSSVNSWASPLKIWYGYSRGGSLDPPYVRSYMGNYYDDHGSVDADVDGICDTAYNLPDTEPSDNFSLYESESGYI